MHVRDYTHVSYDPSKTCQNVTLEHDNDLDKYSTFRGYVLDYYMNNDCVRRFNIDTQGPRATSTLCSFVVSGSRDFISSFENREELIDYFKESLEFLKEEYPDFHILDATIHFDEQGLPHMHASYLPIIERDDGHKQFCVSEAQPGKDYFRGFQDRYYNYMCEKYPEKNLQRTDPNKDHDKKMTVREYKEFKDFQNECREKRDKAIGRLEQLKDVEKKIDDREQELQPIMDYLDKLDEYCNENGLTLYQYQKDLFYADRGLVEYPEPEKWNPERNLEAPELEQKHDREIER